MAYTRFDRIVWAVLGLLVLAIAGVMLAGDHVGVGLDLLSPSGEGQAAASAPLVLRFDQPMVAASLEGRLRIQPEVPYRTHWQEQTLIIQPQSPWQVGETYTLSLEAGVESQLGHQLLEDYAYTFTVREPGLAFLVETDQGRELWAASTLGEDPARLSSPGHSVFDFGVAPDGERLVYSTANEGGGLDLVQVTRDGQADLLLNCGLDRCTNPAWSPDGSQIAYSRAPAGLDEGQPYGPLRVWLLDVFSGETFRLHADTQKLGYSPVWSPDGGRLAYFNGVEGRIVVVDMQSGDETYLPTGSGAAGTWSPDGQHMLFYDIQTVGGQALNVIYRADFANQDVLPLFDPLPSDASYSSPAWSPDGEWVAFRVRPLEVGPGDQVWITPADGAYALVVSGDEGYIHSDLEWDSSGQRLLFKRIALGVSFPDQEIWLWTREDNQLEQVVPDGTMPVWLP